MLPEDVEKLRAQYNICEEGAAWEGQINPTPSQLSASLYSE
jgi:hypothetical protein